MEITTYPLKPNQLEEILPFITSFFEVSESVEVMYGWECNVENQYEFFPVLRGNLAPFLRDGIRNGKFLLGASDIYINDKKQVLELLLCHESDIHLKSSNELILKKLESELKKMNIQYTSVKKGKL